MKCMGSQQLHKHNSGVSVASILVVDDEESIREVLRGFLRKLGHEVNVTEDGTAVISLCDELNPDLVISDIYMPRQDGIETILAMRKHHPNIKIIAMSGEQLGADINMLKTASMLGAVGILQKPFKFEEVEELVVQALGES